MMMMPWSDLPLLDPCDIRSSTQHGVDLL